MADTRAAPAGNGRTIELPVVCTIITPDYLNRALTLHQSLTLFRPVQMHVLVQENSSQLPGLEACREHFGPDIRFYTLDDIYTDPSTVPDFDSDSLRWSSKSVFLIHLIQDLGHDAVLYLDNDLCFYSDFEFLWDTVRSHAMVVTPHWRPILPAPNAVQFKHMFTDGLYNAGCVGASRAGLKALRWWQTVCHHKCEINVTEGLYVDQKYLDALPIYFDDIHVLKHPGCNVAEWNSPHLKRAVADNGVMLAGHWPLVFVHYSPCTMNEIREGRDEHLEPHLIDYLRAVEEQRKYLIEHHVELIPSEEAPGFLFQGETVPIEEIEAPAMTSRPLALKKLDIFPGMAPWVCATHFLEQPGVMDVCALHNALPPGSRLEWGMPDQMSCFGANEFEMVRAVDVLQRVHDPAAVCEEMMRVGQRGYVETLPAG